RRGPPASAGVSRANGGADGYRADARAVVVRAAGRAGVDEGAGRAAAGLRRTVAVREDRAPGVVRSRHDRQWIVSDAARAPRRNHHAELAAFRASPQWRARHSSGCSPPADPRTRRSAVDLRSGVALAVPAG